MLRARTVLIRFFEEELLNLSVLVTSWRTAKKNLMVRPENSKAFAIMILVPLVKLVYLFLICLFVY